MTVGPPTDQGFFYDFYSPHGEVVSEANYSNIEESMKKIIKSKLRFERLELTRDEALEMFQENKSKLRFNIKISMVEKSPEAAHETLKDEPRTTKGKKN